MYFLKLCQLLALCMEFWELHIMIQTYFSNSLLPAGTNTQNVFSSVIKGIIVVCTPNPPVYVLVHTVACMSSPDTLHPARKPLHHGSPPTSPVLLPF